jgi:hypothetical protein
MISYFFGSKGQIKPHQASRGVAHVWPEIGGHWDSMPSAVPRLWSILHCSPQARQGMPGKCGWLPGLVNTQKAIEIWPVEIVDLPIFTYIKVVIFHIVM